MMNGQKLWNETRPMMNGQKENEIIIIIIIDLISPLLQMSKGDTIYRFYTKYSLPAQHAG